MGRPAVDRAEPDSPERGSLTVVGTGIALRVHMTAEAESACKRADELLYLVTEPLTAEWLAGLNRASRSLHTLYRDAESRSEIYADMVDEILASVRQGRRVCVAFYGHPGVFVHASHEAVRRAREEGFAARMLPAISAEDCLFADLGLDPAQTGCQSYDATDFLVHRRRPDPSAALILWQISVVGQVGWAEEPAPDRLPVLVDYLREWYPAEHEIAVYEASPYPIAGASIQWLAVRDLGGAEVRPMSTLYVPPSVVREPDPDMLARLGIAPDG